jgi:hypothetical protein
MGIREPWPLEVDVLDVQRKHLLRASGGLIQQPPQRFLTHRDVVSAPEPVELSVRDRLGPIDGLAAALEPVRDRRVDPAAAQTEARE